MQAPELPHNFEAEQALLGSILVNNSAYQRVAEFLRPEHFADPMHGKIFASAGRLIDNGQQVNPVMLRTYVEQDADVQRAGGMRYIAKLTAASMHVADAAQFGRLIHNLYLDRQLIDLGERIIAEAYGEGGNDAARLIESCERGLYGLASSGVTGSEAKPFSSLLAAAATEAEAAHKRDGGLSGVPTGFVGLDDLLGGLHKSDLIILAARPAMGKTSLATNIGFNAARAFREEDVDGQRTVIDGAGVGFFSLEMSGTQLTNRILAEQAKIPANKIRQGKLTPLEFERYLTVMKQLEHLRLFVDDTPALTIGAIRTRARRLKRQHGIGLIVVDYLQFVDSSHRKDGRVQEVSEVSRGLKALAKELDVPVLALSQLSRNVENRTDKRPQLADLRDSGTIEQDADVVLFIYRDEYYLERSDKKNTPEHIASMGLAEVMVAKHRHGPTGTIPLRFEGAFTKFSDMGNA